MTWKDDQAASENADLSGTSSDKCSSQDSEQTQKKFGTKTGVPQEKLKEEKVVEIEINGRPLVSTNGEEIRSCVVGDIDGDTVLTQRNSQDKDEGVPIDKGWAWVVAFSKFYYVSHFTFCTKVDYIFSEGHRAI